MSTIEQVRHAPTPGRSTLAKLISAAMVEHYAASCDHFRTTPIPYVDDKIFVCGVGCLLSFPDAAPLTARIGTGS